MPPAERPVRVGCEPRGALLDVGHEAIEVGGGPVRRRLTHGRHDEQEGHRRIATCELAEDDPVREAEPAHHGVDVVDLDELPRLVDQAAVDAGLGAAFDDLDAAARNLGALHAASGALAGEAPAMLEQRQLRGSQRPVMGCTDDAGAVGQDADLERSAGRVAAPGGAQEQRNGHARHGQICR